jgi:hypothetical protein
VLKSLSVWVFSNNSCGSLGLGKLPHSVPKGKGTPWKVIELIDSYQQKAPILKLKILLMALNKQ